MVAWIYLHIRSPNSAAPLRRWQDVLRPARPKGVVGDPVTADGERLRGSQTPSANRKERSMRPTNATLRRGLYAVFAVVSAVGAAVAALTVPAAPSAIAAPDPCAAGEVAKTLGAVATSTGYYLDTHPQTNQALTTISEQQPGPQSLGALRNYFDANPQAGKDMARLQQPLVNLSGRCKLPLTLPQLMGLMATAQAATSAPLGIGDVLSPPVAGLP
jgi:hemophore